MIRYKGRVRRHSFSRKRKLVLVTPKFCEIYSYYDPAEYPRQWDVRVCEYYMNMGSVTFSLLPR